MSVQTSSRELIADRPIPQDRFSWRMENVAMGLVGQAGAWLDVVGDGEGVVVRPNRPLPRRCTIRPVGRFTQARGFPDVSTVMGKLVFANGSTQEQRYTPFTRDPERELKELYLPVEPMPEDEWPSSAVRWSNSVAITKQLFSAADVPWDGLHGDEIGALVEFVPCTETIECCALHGLAAWTHARGACLVEIGSFRGRSLAMLALGLRSVGSEAKIISVDPHESQPTNCDQVRLTLAPLSEERRVVQFVGRSDQAWRFLRPGSASLVFIDGDHSRKQVLEDFENYRGLVAPGGCMVFHDYGFGNHSGQPDTDPDVRAVVDEVVFADRDFTPLLLAQTLMAFVRRKG